MNFFTMDEEKIIKKEIRKLFIDDYYADGQDEFIQYEMVRITDEKGLGKAIENDSSIKELFDIIFLSAEELVSKEEKFSSTTFDKVRLLSVKYFTLIRKIMGNENNKIDFLISMSEINAIFSRSVYIYCHQNNISIVSNKVYMNLVKYYNLYRGYFEDNEEAIAFMCMNYKEDYKLSKDDKSLLSEALYSNVSMAGRPNDMGYAFGGIKCIENNIKFIPEEIIVEVIKLYEVRKGYYDYIDLDMTRLQIYTMLKYKELEKSKFIEYKYASIDYRYIYNKLELIKLKNPIIEIDFSEIELNPKLEKCELSFEIDKKVFTYSFDADDWSLDKLGEELNEIIFKEKNYLKFKYVYLNGYRDLDEIDLNFDRAYHFSRTQKKLRKQNNLQNIQFYSAKISSISCIVGRNGQGKTSVVEFLTNDFFDLIKNDKEMLYYSYLVVFSYNDKDYYYSNLEDLDIDENLEMAPYKLGKGINSLSKIMYYSSKVELNQGYGPKWNTVNDNQTNLNIIDLTQQLRLKEQMGDARYNKEQREGASYNKENLYKVSFIKSLSSKSQDVISELLWKEFDLRKLNSVFEIDAIAKKEESIISRQEPMYILSSGQEMKLSMLSRIFWFLKGLSLHLKSGLNVKYPHQSTYLLEKNSAAVIFIDEGELYYHPEWQRKFINDLIYMIDEFAPDGVSLQIILTTNSPFILSDIRSEDVHYLGAKPNERLTFAQNIHTLLSNNFYMEYTIGEFSRNKIQYILSKLDSNNISAKEIELIKEIIDEIGEPVLKKSLQNRLKPRLDRDEEIKSLKNRLKELEAEDD